MNLVLMKWFRREPRLGSLGDLLARQGIDWPALARVASVGEFADALGKCTACSAKSDCGRWLAAGQRDGYNRFCVNAEFVDSMKERAAR